MFRELKLPMNVRGKLFLHSMPGRLEAWARAAQALVEQRISAVICLARDGEIADKSREYGQALREGALPCAVIRFEIPDFGVPDDRESFLSLACEIAKRLLKGEHILIHCGFGIGRTGTLAECVLVALGQTVTEAHRVVTEAGSGPEKGEQQELIDWFATRVQAVRSEL